MNPSAGHSRYRLFLAGIIVALAGLRSLVAIVPDAIFDIDPLSASFTFPGLGPGMSIMLDALLVLFASLALESERQRRGLDYTLLLLVMLPLLPLMWHSTGSVLDLWRGADWFAGAMSAAAIAHLIRSTRCREIAIALLIGVVAVTAVRGAWQIFVEHPATVEHFEEHRDEVLGMHGWTEGSTPALTYERRLRQSEATGWIGFSNITSAMFAAGGLMLFGLAWTGARGRDHLGTVVGLVLLGSAMLVVCVLNGSKGAIAAGILGAVFLLGLNLPGHIGPWLRSRGGVVVIGCAAVAVAVVLIRGVIPEGTLGEKSLLFRFHYLEAGLRMLAESPGVGVGPDGYQNAYPALQNVRNPETPASAHSVWLDWLVSLGPLGLAWIGAMGLLLLRKAPEPTDSDQRPLVPASWAAAFGAAFFTGVVAVQWYVESAVLDQPGLIMRIAGGVLGMATTVLVIDGFRRAPEYASRMVALVAALVFVVQGQIEMIFWNPSSVVCAWVLVALAGSARSRESQRGAWGWPVLAAVVSLMLFLASGRILLSESQMHRAAQPLLELAQRETPPSAAEIEEARWRVASALVVVDNEGKPIASEPSWWDLRRVRAAVSQLNMIPNVEDRVRALELANAWIVARPNTDSFAMRGGVVRSLHASINDVASRDDAIEATWDEIPWRPYDPELRIILAELLLQSGDAVGAAAQLEEGIRLDALRDLDPLARFSQEKLEAIEELRARLSAAEGDQIIPK